MKTLITRIKRLALALCFVTPLVSWAAVDYTGTDYEPWNGVAGAVVWRATTSLFHTSTVANIADDGTIGSTYTMTADSDTTKTWKRFASNQGGIYTSPGMLLVYDEDGKTASSDAQFAPLSFGGLWVKALQAEGVPYSITDNKTDGTARNVELGAANTSTYFKFDKSFTIDRNSATEVKGTATVEIADGATFTINNRASKGAKVDSGNTLVLKGANTGTLKVVAGLTVGGTLDLSAATRPAIDGDVTLSAGSTIVLPAGTDVSETPFTVCSGTLTAGGVIYVKVGTDDAEKAVISTSAGTITAVATTVTYTATIDGDTAFSAIEWTVGGEAATITSMDIAVLEISGTGVVTGLTEAPAKVTLASGVTLDVTELSAEAFAGIEKSTAGTYRWTSGFPITVPQGWTYEYVGGSTEAGTVTISEGMLNDQGNLKTSGYLSIDNFWMGWTTASLDILDGKTTIGANSNEKALRGTVTIREDAELVNTRESDALAYDASAVVNVYGTLSMGATRWSLGSNNTLNFYEGCTVTGSGQSSNGTFDWIENATATLNVDGDVTLAAPIRIRSTATVNVNVDTTEQKGLTLAGTLGVGKIVKKGAGLVKFTTNPPYAITVERGAFTFAVDATPTITYSAKPGAGTSMSMWYAKQATWKGTVVIGALAAPAALPLDTYGNANSKIVLTGTTGNCYLNGTTTVAAELVVGTNANNVVEFNNGNSNQVGTFSKVSGPGTLRLKAWTGCQAATYVLNTLNNFEGLAVANNITRNGGGTFTIRIGNIVTTRTTNPGDCVLPIVNTAVDNTTGTVVYDLANAKVNGTALDLEAKSDGIYVVVPTVTITVPEVPNTTVTVANGGETIGTAAGNYEVAPGSVVTVTYAAASGYAISGTTEYTIDTSKNETTFEITDTATAQYVAQIRTGATTYEKYTTLADALDSANIAYGITLLADVTENNVTVDSAAIISGNYTINANVTIANGGQLQLMLATLNGTLTIQDGGTYVTLGGTLGNVVVQDGGIINLTSLSEDAAPLTVSTLTVNGALTIVSSYGSAERGKTYKAISYATGSATIAEGASFNGSGEWSASTVVDGDNTVVCLEITKVAVVDGVYYDTAQEAVEAAVSSGKPAEFLVQPGTVTLGAGETLVVKGGYQPTVELDAGLSTPPYEVKSSYDLETFMYTYAVKSYVAQIGNTKYESLADAVDAATSGQTVKLLADVTLTDKLVVSNKTVTITADSAKTITGQLRVVDGSNVTIGTNVTITSDKNPTVFVLGDPAVKMAGTAKSTLVVNGTVLNTNAGFDQTFAIAGNGLDTQGVDITINGTVRNANGIAIYQAFPGDLVVNGTVEGASAISIKDGTLTVNDDAAVTATLADGLAYVGNNNGDSPTGDAIIAPYYDLSRGYGTPVVSILGGTITVADTTNCSGIEAYDYDGVVAPYDSKTNVNVSGGLFNTPVAKVYCASGYIPCEVTGGYSVKVQTTIDPTDPTSTQEVTVDTSLTAEEQEAAAIEAATVTVPTAAAEAGVDAATYKGYFTYSATATATEGVYEVAIANLKEETVFPASESAELTADLADVLDVAAGADVEITTAKPGLYYSIEAAENVGFTSGKVEGARELATTTTVAPKKPTVTGTPTAVFFRVKVSATPNNN